MSTASAGARRPFFRRRKVCPFSGDNAPAIDYKDTRLLQRYAAGTVAPLVALFPLFAVVLSYFFLRGEQLHAIGLLGIVVSVAGVILLLAGS